MEVETAAEAPAVPAAPAQESEAAAPAPGPPRLASEVFARHRELVREQLGEDALLVAFTRPLAVRNGDVEHDHRADSDFYYLTGLEEPEACVVLSSRGDAPFTLFLRARDPDREVWDGPRLGVEGARRELGANAAHPIGELAERLPKLLEGHRRLHYRLGRDAAADELVLTALETTRRRERHGIEWPTSIVEPEAILHEARLRKSTEEIELMSRACAVTALGFERAMRMAAPGRWEYEIAAAIAEAFEGGGSDRVAYRSIVASGPNACVLHYASRHRRLGAGELLLVDAGCELGMYASDVTRTFPVDGVFTEPQAELYDVVLDAQLAAIEATRPGKTVDEVHYAALRVVVAGLERLGLVDGPFEKILEEKSYRPFYMHRTSHFLGLDVHDAGRYTVGGKSRKLEPGMVITVEPGIYVAPDAKVSERYRGIGIRIEDDVAVTEGEPQVLSSAIPKRRDEVERACRSA